MLGNFLALIGVILMIGGFATAFIGFIAISSYRLRRVLAWSPIEIAALGNTASFVGAVLLAVGCLVRGQR